MSLNPELIETKNLLHSSSAWVTLAHLAVVNEGGDIRIACNVTFDITWNGYKWTALPVEIGVIKEDRDEIPQLEIKISNITKIPESFAESYEGLTDSILTLYDVNTRNLSEITNIPTYKIKVKNTSFDLMWAHFTLSINPDPLSYKDPKEKIFKNFCRFGYPNSVDSRCPYTGDTYSTCARTLANCITRNGATIAKRYGGFPAIGTNKIYAN